MSARKRRLWARLGYVSTADDDRMLICKKLCSFALVHRPGPNACRESIHSGFCNFGVWRVGCQPGAGAGLGGVAGVWLARSTGAGLHKCFAAQRAYYLGVQLAGACAGCCPGWHRPVVLYRLPCAARRVCFWVCLAPQAAVRVCLPLLTRWGVLPLLLSAVGLVAAHICLPTAAAPRVACVSLSGRRCVDAFCVWFVSWCCGWMLVSPPVQVGSPTPSTPPVSAGAGPAASSSTLTGYHWQLRCSLCFTVLLVLRLHGLVAQQQPEKVLLVCACVAPLPAARGSHATCLCPAGLW